METMEKHWFNRMIALLREDPMTWSRLSQVSRNDLKRLAVEFS